MQESQRLVASVIQILEKVKAPGAADFKKLAVSMIKTASPSPVPIERSNSMAAPKSSKSTPSPSMSRQQIRPQIYRQASATMSENDLLSQQEKLRRATLPHIALNRPEHASYGRASLDSIRSESPMSRREYRPSSSKLPTVLQSRSSVKNEKPPNLDYLSLSNTPVTSQPQSPIQSRSKPSPLTHHSNNTTHTPIFPPSTSSYIPTPALPSKSTGVSASEWEVLLGSLDGGQTNLYDAIYGGPAISLHSNSDSASTVISPSYGDWSPDSAWDMASLTMGDFATLPAGQARSVLSFSEESLSSGEEFSTSEFGGGGRRSGEYGMMAGENYLLEGLDANFGL